ncbi:MAG: DUF456 domain-containing protein [Bacillota bacterium]
MSAFLWVIIILLFFMSLIGVVVPVIPDTILLWLAFGLSYFIEGIYPLPLSFWIGMIIITLLIFGSDLLSNILVARKYGVSRWGILGALAGLILGIIVLGPVGVVLGPFIMVFAISYMESGDHNRSFKKAWGAIIAFFSSSLTKIILQIIMIIWFLLVI